MLSLAATFDKIKLENVTDASPRSVAALAKELNLERPFSLRDVMSAAWEEVTFLSDGLTLVGYLFKPLGPGPFPAIIWNHGSEDLKDKDSKPDRISDSEFSAVAANFVPEGYVVFCPVRRGHGKSEGEYTVDDPDAGKLLAQEMQGPWLNDQLAGLQYLKSLPYVDSQRLAVIGWSYGAIQSLLGAERGAGYKGAIAISAAAQSWKNELLQDLLEKAVPHIDIPVLLIYPRYEATIGSDGPAYTLGQWFEDEHKAYGLMIFPPYGNDKERGHSFGGADGIHIWAPSVLQFLDEFI